MIIGYQVQDTYGNKWGNRPTFHVLTERTAIQELKEARDKVSDSYVMVAIQEGDIPSPTFEDELASSSEQYKTLAVSTGHLADEEHAILDRLANDIDCNKIAGRETGWFVKLAESPSQNLGYDRMSDKFHSILLVALNAGYRMVEFDNCVDFCQKLEHALNQTSNI